MASSIRSLEVFGTWVNNIETLSKDFKNAVPFPHVVIENFLKLDIAEGLYDAFPKVTDDQKWIIYNNPIEKKYALTDFSNLPIYRDLFAILQTEQFVDLMKRISDIGDLEADPHLHGAGLHQHISGGKLDMHLDYSIHPVSGRERRVNLIIYLSKDWNDYYNGAIEFWDQEFTRCERKIFPSFNKAVLFRTSDMSYHGLPTPIRCPETNSRKSIAIYYVSEPRSDLSKIRYKAQFRALPNQPYNDKLEQLYRIREKRSLNEQDLETIYSNWELDGNGFW